MTAIHQHESVTELNDMTVEGIVAALPQIFGTIPENMQITDIAVCFAYAYANGKPVGVGSALLGTDVEDARVAGALLLLNVLRAITAEDNDN